METLEYRVCEDKRWPDDMDRERAAEGEVGDGERGRALRASDVEVKGTRRWNVDEETTPVTLLRGG